jgi:ABC-type polar amino acid transport system ATPase subunit
MAEEKYILRVENIKKAFGKNEVLNGVSFNVKKGETICFIGPPDKEGKKGTRFDGEPQSPYQ